MDYILGVFYTDKKIKKKDLGEFEIHNEDEVYMLKEKVSLFAAYTHILRSVC